MVKSGLIQKLCDLYPDLLYRDLAKTVDIIFDEIINATSINQQYQLRHFGTFKTTIRKARQSRNPKSGDSIVTKEKKVPVFKMSKMLRLRLNSEI